jgi:hypothetical protein
LAILSSPAGWGSIKVMWPGHPGPTGAEKEGSSDIIGCSIDVSIQ